MESSFRTPYRSSSVPESGVSSTPSGGVGMVDEHAISDSQLLSLGTPASWCSPEGTRAARIQTDPEIIKARLKARVAQAQQIRQKKACGSVRPEAGMLYELRQQPGGTCLREAVQGQRPATYTTQQVQTDRD